MFSSVRFARRQQGRAGVGRMRFGLWELDGGVGAAADGDALDDLARRKPVLFNAWTDTADVLKWEESMVRYYKSFLFFIFLSYAAVPSGGG
jgi:hypothetical protein